MELNQLLIAKNNEYKFSDRSSLLKNIYKTMDIPFSFQTERYKHHLQEDLLYLDIILFPTMKKLKTSDFANYRPFNLFPLGIVSGITFAMGMMMTM
jgi:hypothetical protein